MAIPSIKATYSLDTGTVRALERMARRWGISKSEALRRAIRAAERALAEEPGSPLEALDQLQRAAGLDAGRARQWAQAARAARRAASEHRRTDAE